MSCLSLASMMIKRRFFGDKRVCSVFASSGRFDHGMTLIEVLISILLFAVFMGNFLLVAEIMSQWMPSGQPSSGSSAASSCDSPQLETACVEVALDSAVPSLQSYYDKNKPDDFIPIEGVYGSPAELPLGDSASADMAWPEDYKIKISSFSRLVEKPTSGSPSWDSSRPGLYLIAAYPRTPAYWRKPVVRLFCRPYHRCVRP